MEKITEKDARVTYYFNSINRMTERLINLFKNHRPGLGHEHYITDRELSRYLRVDRRTLTDYRRNGVLPYVSFGGKILYKESEIQKILSDSYSPKKR